MIRIKQLREEAGYTQQDLADKLNKAKSTIAMYENETRKPSLRVLKQLSNIFNCSVDYILGLSDNPKKENTFTLNREDIFEALKKIAEPNNKRLLPVLGVVKAGYNYLAEQNIIDYINPYMENVDSENFFALLVKGDSMFPHFNDGDYVVVQKTDGCFESGKICVVLIDDEEATIKKVIKTEEGIELHAFNPYYPVRKYSFKEIKDLKIIILGVVEYQIRNWK